MPASPTNTAEQVLILNTAFDVSGESGPLLDNLETFQSASPWRRVSGDTAPLQIILVDDGGTVAETPRRVILASGNTLHLSAKVDPADNDQALDLTFTQAGAAGSEYYVADPGTLAVADSVFNGNPSANLLVDLIEKNSGGDVLRQWRTTLCLLWSTASGGVSSPITFVSYSVQSPTGPQQTQALNNLGGTTVGKAVFQAADAAAARTAIGAGTGSGNLIDEGTITLANAGKVAVITALKTLGAGVAYDEAATASTLVKRDALGAITNVTGRFGGQQSETLLDVGNTAAVGKYVWLSNVLDGFDFGGFKLAGSTAKSLEVVAYKSFVGLIQVWDTDGLLLKTANGTTVATFGVSNSTEVTFAGVATVVGLISNGLATIDDDLDVTGEARVGALQVNGKAIETGGKLTLSGAYNFTGTLTGVTTVTFPTSGTLATLAGSETLTNKTLTLPTINGFTEGVVAIGNSGTSQTIAITAGTIITCTLTGNCTFTMPTATAGKSFTLFLNTGAGSLTGTFTGVKWAGGTTPTITATASRLDILAFVADGTNWYGSALQNFTP